MSSGVYFPWIRSRLAEYDFTLGIIPPRWYEWSSSPLYNFGVPWHMLFDEADILASLESSGL